MKFAPEIEVIEEVDIDQEVVKLYALVVFNDDLNTFDNVINALIEVCGHTKHQAEQCTIIIHHKGKCAVKNGDFDELKPFRTAITDRGIGAEIILR